MSIEFNPSRRRFLGMSSRALLGAELLAISGRESVVPVWQELQLQKRALTDSRLPNKDFVDTYSLTNTQIGFSFSPEMFNLTTELLKNDPAAYAKNKERAKRSLRFAISEMGCRQARLGIRWDQCVDEEGKFDFAQYEWLLEEAFDLGAQVTLNTGPTRTFRWKEDFVPNFVLDKLSEVPPKGYVIREESELAKYGVEHAYQLFDHVAPLLNQNSDQFVGVQPQNEGFFPFGENEWTVSPGYMQKHMEIIHEMFPGKTILLNSAASHNVVDIQNVFKQIRRKHKDVNLCMGVDFHPLKPHMVVLPKIGLVDDFTLGVVKDFGRDVLSENKKVSQSEGYDIEGTEIQGEPWNEEIRPGNHAPTYKYTLGRFMQKVVPERSRLKTIIRYWGVEHLSTVFEDGNDTKEHREILDLNQQVNFS